MVCTSVRFNVAWLKPPVVTPLTHLQSKTRITLLCKAIFMSISRKFWRKICNNMKKAHILVTSVKLVYMAELLVVICTKSPHINTIIGYYVIITTTTNKYWLWMFAINRHSRCWIKLERHVPPNVALIVFNLLLFIYVFYILFYFFYFLFV